MSKFDLQKILGTANAAFESASLEKQDVENTAKRLKANCQKLMYAIAYAENRKAGQNDYFVDFTDWAPIIEVIWKQDYRENYLKLKQTADGYILKTSKDIYKAKSLNELNTAFGQFIASKGPEFTADFETAMKMNLRDLRSAVEKSGPPQKSVPTAKPGARRP